MKAYYKIGEISKIYDIGKDSLMYYETLGLLKPIRNEKGYRFYSIQDIWRLNLIKELRSLDVPMKRIKSYVDTRDVSTTKQMLKEEKKLIVQKINELKSYEKNIGNRLRNIEEVQQEAIETIREIYMPTRKAMLLSANITRDEEVDILLQKLQQKYDLPFNIIGNKQRGALFEPNAFQEGRYNVFQSVFCLVEPQEEGDYFEIPKGNYLTYTYKGAYAYNGKHIQQLLSYMEDRNYELAGIPLEIYKLDIHETAKEDEYTTEIQIPIKKSSV